MTLAVVLDQNVPPSIAGFLQSRRPDWNIRRVRDFGLSGAADSVIFDWAQQYRAIVITFDEDFADARMYPVGSHAGVVRLRVWPTTVAVTEAALDRLLTTVPDDALPGSLVIIGNENIRVRRAAQHG